MRGKLLDSLAMAGVAVLGAASAPMAFGQQGASAQAGGLEEIVVTATRRASNLQDVPISIVALTSDDLARQGIDSIERLQGAIPNLSVIGGTNGGTSEVGFSIRGIPRVGFYIDGIWQPYTSGLMDFTLADIERIEVLRGPQGTLYGRDSTGGAIRVVTAEPGKDFGLTADMALGTYDRRDAQVRVDVPLGDNVHTRWSATQLKRNGYVHSVTLDKDLGQIDTTDLSGDILWTPSEKFSMRMKYSNNVAHPTDARISFRAVPQGANLVGFQYGAIDLYTLAGKPYDSVHEVAGYPGGQLGKWETAVGDSEPATIETSQASVEIKYDLTDSMKLDSWTGYINFHQQNLIDWDNSPYEAIEVYQYDKAHLFSQELQLSGKKGRIDWVGGLYYWKQASASRQPFWGFEEFKRGELSAAAVAATPQCQVPSTLLGCAGAIGVYESIGSTDAFNSRAENGYAAFGEVDISLNDKLNLTVGARYHNENRDVFNLSALPGVSAVKPTHPGPFTSGDPYAGQISSTDQSSFNKLTTRIALKRQFTKNAMGYASYSEGFNAGGADPAGTARYLVKFDPESIKTYEVGMRTDLVNGRLRFNASLFHTDWNDIQIRSNFVDPSIGVYAVTIVTQNAAGAKANGLETELTWLATEKLKINANVGVLNTAYTKLLLGSATPVHIGDDFAQAPYLTYSLGLQHTAALKSGGTLTSRVDYSYVGGFNRYPDPAYHPKALGLGYRYEAGDNGLLNARIAYVPPGKTNWEVSVFGTNLTNEQVIDGGFYGSIWELDWSTVGRPREAGIQLKVSF